MDIEQKREEIRDWFLANTMCQTLVDDVCDKDEDCVTCTILNTQIDEILQFLHSQEVMVRVWKNDHLATFEYLIKEE
jgi:hypothetical protein